MEKMKYILLGAIMLGLSACQSDYTGWLSQVPDVEEEIGKKPIKPTVHEIPVTRPEEKDPYLEINNRIHEFSWKLFREYYSTGNGNVLIAPFEMSFALHSRMEKWDKDDQFRLRRVMELNKYPADMIEDYFYDLNEYFADISFMQYGVRTRYKKSYAQESDKFVRIPSFYGLWLSSFDAGETKRMLFSRADGTKEETDMMFRCSPAYYHEFDSYAIVRVSFMDRNFDSFFILPNEGYTVDDVIKRINPSDFLHDSIKRVYLWMPKINVSQQNVLDMDVLQRLGFSSSDTRAEQVESFSPIWLDNSFSVAEKGVGDIVKTDTWSSSYSLNYSTEYLFFRLNRPFIYGILHRHRNTPLFIGYYGY